MSAGGSPDVQALIAELLERPWGQVSPSVYETGRLVTLSPWLTGDVARIGFLLDAQRADGGWGAADDGYALVPTLSATEALLSVRGRRRRHDRGPADHGPADHGPADHGPADHGPADARLTRAAVRGLDMLADLLAGNGPLVPDMPAIELIVPYLIGRINRHLAAPDLPWRGGRLTPPPGMEDAKLKAVRRALAGGGGAPRKLLHALEVAGDVACGLPHIRPELTGTIGASPAATAAWLGDRGPAQPGDAARWHLETVSALHGGPVPCGYPITVFERAWVVTWLARSGVPVTAPPQLVLSLTAPLGPAGTPAAAGLPADADTTAGALYALSLLNARHRPDPLWEYETPSHFCTWRGEEGASTTTNAHVLEAFGHYLEETSDRIGHDAARRYAAAVGKAAAWLRDQQRADGSWTDRWHASPYYATACCALALARFDRRRSAAALARARRWVLATQRPDGSWGRWRGTAEETAYAVQVLLAHGSGAGDEPEPPPDESCVRAAMRGRAHLARSLAAPRDGDAAEPALWHDKDLYRPAAIVRAVVLGALHLTSAERLAFVG
ncbi:MAG TPA: prenyltransferase/squalene oxidase repeat-containing protein [Streptosporangiaceae bacterium]|nr:prenyltransferase/squalene oxidase repeat-containing protein [Streptosporangiaceae bacterium]